VLWAAATWDDNSAPLHAAIRGIVALDAATQDALQTAVLALGAPESAALAEDAARAPGADSARLTRLARMARRAAQ
jgi:hypothetical protein